MRWDSCLESQCNSAHAAVTDAVRHTLWHGFCSVHCQSGVRQSSVLQKGLQTGRQLAIAPRVLPGVVVKEEDTQAWVSFAEQASWHCQKDTWLILIICCETVKLCKLMNQPTRSCTFSRRKSDLTPASGTILDY